MVFHAWQLVSDTSVELACVGSSVDCIGVDEERSILFKLVVEWLMEGVDRRARAG